MKILGIDTSTRISSLAIIENEEIVVELNINSNYKKTSSILVLAIQDLLKRVDWKLDELDGLAVSLGPGSFTGLRVGLGVVKGLSYATSLPVVGVNSLDVLAYSWKEAPFLICPLLECKKGELFYGVFKYLHGLEKIIDYKCESLDRLLMKISVLKEKILIIGERIENYRTQIEKELSQKVILIETSPYFPGGANVARLGLERLKKGEKDDIFTMIPFYLRKSQAEVVWEKRKES